MAKVLVYGGSGIISTEIVKRAIGLGHEVTIVNRGRRRAFIHPEAKCIVADLRNDTVTSIKSRINGKYDTIIDMLSYTPAELERNMMIAEGNCEQYIFASSATVYETKDSRYQESDAIGQSAWGYANDKAMCEKLLAQKAYQFGFSYTIIRPYVTYGKTRIPFQFAPLEYYTIIHRMKNDKVVVLSDKAVACTLTWAKDFAVAAVGLIRNSKAYGEAYHITGAYETTWEKALYLVADAFQTKCDVVKVDVSFFGDSRRMRGLNGIEVIADKGRDMLFNSSKIREAVPEFVGASQLEETLPEIVQYFESTPTARRINYAWDARLDHALSKTNGLTKTQRRKLKYVGNEQSTFHDWLTYTIHRYDTLYLIYLVVQKVLLTVKKQIK